MFDVVPSPLSAAQPGRRGPSEAPGGLREGQRRREADEHRQQAESGSCSDPAPTAQGKRPLKHMCVCEAFLRCEDTKL